MSDDKLAQDIQDIILGKRVLTSESDQVYDQPIIRKENTSDQVNEDMSFGEMLEQVCNDSVQQNKEDDKITDEMCNEVISKCNMSLMKDLLK